MIFYTDCKKSIVLYTVIVLYTDVETILKISFDKIKQRIK